MVNANPRSIDIGPIFINNNLTLHCPIESKKSPRVIHWFYKSNHPSEFKIVCAYMTDASDCYTSPEYYKLFSNAIISAENLQLVNVQIIHDGVYQCRYINETSVVKYTFDVIILDDPKLKYIDSVAINEVLNLHCPVERSSNSGVKLWVFHPGRSRAPKSICMKMPYESQCFKSNVDDPLFVNATISADSIQIDRVTKLHDGIYECKFVNATFMAKYSFEVIITGDYTCDFCEDWPKVINFKRFCVKPLRMKVKVLSKRNEDGWIFYDLYLEQIWPSANRDIIFQGWKNIQVRLSEKLAQCECLQLSISKSYLMMDTNFFFARASESNGTIITKKSVVEEWQDHWGRHFISHTQREYAGKCNRFYKPSCQLAMLRPLSAP